MLRMLGRRKSNMVGTGKHEEGGQVNFPGLAPGEVIKTVSGRFIVAISGQFIRTPWELTPEGSERLAGGIAALNHRLIAPTPPGSIDSTDGRQSFDFSKLSTKDTRYPKAVHCLSC